MARHQFIEGHIDLAVNPVARLHLVLSFALRCPFPPQLPAPHALYQRGGAPYVRLMTEPGFDSD